MCPGCGNFADGIIEDQVKSRLISKNTIKSISLETRDVGNRIIAKVSCTGIIKPLKSVVKYQKTITITTKKTKCENCIKLLGGYYEAVFQVRGESKDRIMNKIKKLIPDESVVNVDSNKTGYDIKLVDKKIAARAVKYLREYFQITDSYKLVGEKKGKRLYRNFYAIR